MSRKYAVTSTVEMTVSWMSKILPWMMPRSCSMSNTSASTERREPKRRVENHTKPTADQIPTAPLTRTASPTSAWIGLSGLSAWRGSSRSMSAMTSAEDWSSERLRTCAMPETRSRMKGSAAMRMLNATPDARKNTLSSPLLSHTRLA